jgi:hypothetical protein
MALPPGTRLGPYEVVAPLGSKCLAKSPEERWQSASDLASELKWISESGGQTAIAVPSFISLGALAVSFQVHALSPALLFLSRDWRGISNHHVSRKRFFHVHQHPVQGVVHLLVRLSPRIAKRR